MRTHLDLFSGIGGFALAARWAGIETVQFVELDPFCQKVLQKNFKGVPIHGDITTFTYRKGDGLEERGMAQLRNTGRQPTGSDGNEGDVARPFLLTGGFPCQPFSCAGKRRGKEDDRYLWPEMLRVVSEAKPTWVIGENVAGFINMGLDDCISDLENQGYEVQAFVIPACAVNAPHRRDRVWIVAHNAELLGHRKHGTFAPITDSNGAQDGLSFQADRHAADTESREAQPAEPGGLHAESGGKNPNAPDTINQGLQGGIGEQPLRYAGQPDRSGSNEKPGWAENWLEVATRLCRVDARVPNRVDRLKSLGNAIVPQVAYEIMKAITDRE